MWTGAKHQEESWAKNAGDDDVCVSLYTHSNREPITKEDNRAPGWVKVPIWNLCTKPMGAIAKKVESKQKRDNRRSPIAGVYTLGCV